LKLIDYSNILCQLIVNITFATQIYQVICRQNYTGDPLNNHKRNKLKKSSVIEE